VAFFAFDDYDISYVGELKTGLLGGEGLFLTATRDPGLVYSRA
jgi:uncharacterized protein (AIM24 family)